MRTVLVTGSRDWTDRNAVWGALSAQVRDHGPFVLVHGGLAVGVDALAHEWLFIEDPYCDKPCCDLETQCRMRTLEESFPVNLRDDGVAGISVRNQHMVDRGADLCIAFVGPNARSSIDCMTRARIAGIPVDEHRPSTGQLVGARGSLCCAACQHPAIEHGPDGCDTYGGFDDCTCTGYAVDPLDLV